MPVTSKRLRSSVKLLAPVVASLAGLAMLRLLGRDLLTRQSLTDWIEPFGELAPIVFIALLAVRPLTLLPGQLFTAVAGILFGTFWATVYALIGSFLAATLVFLLAHRFGRSTMRRLAKERYLALQRAARRHDFKFALLATINPLLPTDVAVAAAAASGGRYVPTVGGVTLATLPGTLLTAQFGSALGEGKSVLAIVSAAAMLLSLGLGVQLGRALARDLGGPAARRSALDLPRRASGEV